MVSHTPGILMVDPVRHRDRFVRAVPDTSAGSFNNESTVHWRPWTSCAARYRAAPDFYRYEIQCSLDMSENVRVCFSVIPDKGVTPEA